MTSLLLTETWHKHNSKCTTEFHNVQLTFATLTNINHHIQFNLANPKSNRVLTSNLFATLRFNSLTMLTRESYIIQPHCNIQRRTIITFIFPSSKSLISLLVHQPRFLITTLFLSIHLSSHTFTSSSKVSYGLKIAEKKKKKKKKSIGKKEEIVPVKSPENHSVRASLHFHLVSVFFLLLA